MRPAAVLARPSTRTLAAVLGLLAAAGPALAEKPRVKIVEARVGLPSGGRTADRDESGRAAGVCKFAAWAPVYVTLELLDEVKEPAVLVVESADADRVATTLTLPLASLAAVLPGQRVGPAELGVLPYLRPGGGSDDPVLTVRTARGAALSDPFRLRGLQPRPRRTYVVLSLGGRLPGFELPKAGSAEKPDATGPIRGGQVELTTIDKVELLPDEWFGYDAADLVVIPTGAGSDEFLQRLFGDRGGASDRARRAALLEWVRRGGRVVVSAGSNAGMLARMPALQELLPATIPPDSPAQAVPELTVTWRGREGAGQTRLQPRAGTFLVANLAPKAGRPARTVIPPPDRLAEGTAKLAVQAAYGLGKVTLVAFDLDRAPFTESAERADFWDWVLREGGAAKASFGSTEEQQASSSPTIGGDTTEAEDELTAALRTHVATFDGVPVISFGWVAVFIVLYILLIGPVEYLFLKKVLGRLELTWVTFPLIVITVSAAAYFTAYAVKGRDLKVNKVDVVDVDPASGRVYGRCWFTVFSPRIDTYTVGVTPAEGWTTEPDDPAGTLVGWDGAPSPGGAGFIVRRRYRYHAEPGAVATGLEDVPIQVWSTKSFVADWSGKINPASPVIESALEHPPGDPERVIGTFVNRMPFPELRDCVVFYADRVHPLPGGTILKDQTVRLVLGEGTEARRWLQEGGPDGPEGQLSTLHAKGQRTERSVGRSAPTAPAAAGSTLPLWGLLFHESALKNEKGGYPRNASLRRLDQSWRLSPENRDEVILVGRALPAAGPAEELLGGPASPSRLWLKGLPGAGRPRQPIPGTARQETYVRVYLPVKPAGAGR